MRTILVALAVTIGDDAPTPAGILETDDLRDYLNIRAVDTVVIGVVDREHPENNVEAQLFTDYAPRSQCDGIAFDDDEGDCLPETEDASYTGTC
jgi:hypothetical protein